MVNLDFSLAASRLKTYQLSPELQVSVYHIVQFHCRDCQAGNHSLTDTTPTTEELSAVKELENLSVLPSRREMSLDVELTGRMQVAREESGKETEVRKGKKRARRREVGECSTQRMVNSLVSLPRPVQLSSVKASSPLSFYDGSATDAKLQELTKYHLPFCRLRFLEPLRRSVPDNRSENSKRVGSSQLWSISFQI